MKAAVPEAMILQSPQISQLKLSHIIPSFQLPEDGNVKNRSESCSKPGGIMAMFSSINRTELLSPHIGSQIIMPKQGMFFAWSYGSFQSIQVLLLLGLKTFLFRTAF